MTLSDWVYVLCTLCLAIVALVAPYLNDLWRRKSLAPKLKIVFQKESPYIGEPKGDNLYSICFAVKNEGNSKAKNCEVTIEEFCFKNEQGDLIENNRDFPAVLLWMIRSNDSPIGPIDILPKTNRFFPIFSIATSTNPEYQEKLLFSMNVERIVLFSKSRILVPLNYLKIKMVIYSENAKKCEQYIEIKSPGIKREKKEQNLQEMQLTLS